MTETVPVPIELLKTLFDHTTITRDVFEGDSVKVSNSALGALIDIKSFLPSPPKVGDTLTAEQIKALPPRSVLVDGEGDLWIVGGDGIVSLVWFNQDYRPHNAGGNAAELAGYNNTLVHIGG